MIEEVFIIGDVLPAVVGAMKVPKPGIVPIQYFTINYEPGRNSQIIDDLKSKDGTSYDSLKYPLVAVVMPVSEYTISPAGIIEVTIPRIIIAYLTKTATNSEKVLDKYSPDGVFKTILRPCMREFIKQLAWSTYTDMGDPDMYEYTFKDQPCQQPIGQGLSDFVDVIEILNLKIPFFSQIKTC